MTYYVHLHNSGYYGRRSFNTKAKAQARAKAWVEMGGDRRADVEPKPKG